MKTMKKIIAIISCAMMVLACVGCAFAAAEITVVSREAGSGTRSAFIELTGVEVKDENGAKSDMTYEDAVVQNGTAQVITTVKGDVNAIGYISLGSMSDAVKAVSVDGIVPAEETILSGEYKIARPLNIAYKGELSKTAEDFVAYILSEAGQEVVSANHYIKNEPAAYTASAVAGKITIGGSSSVAPLMEKLAESYMALHQDVTIELQVSDSSTGMRGALDGTFEIGMASRDLKQSELDDGLTPVTIALDGIAVIVNNDNPVTNLTIEEIRQIFTGEKTEW
ncbi:MAG: substrate-binding domain-containing protein [Eubacteriales bacterium]|nr:substrate-binding domain-containing protein [Eubacteriales bacterium]MDD3883199.1 substrate-binding domain-containing protein [Eubacteriales bacterium]MDD4512725.1 substrate-binding domain-containing protein [Eubacteriales bacterium]